MGAGRYRPALRSGAMHGDRLLVRDLYYGGDGDNLYLRLDFETHPDFTSLELRTERAAVSLLDNPDVQTAQGKILEIRVPFHVLGASKDQPVHFQLAAANRSAAAGVDSVRRLDRAYFRLEYLLRTMSSLPAPAGGRGVAHHDFLVGEGGAVQVSVPVVIRPERRALQRYAGEEPARARVGRGSRHAIGHRSRPMKSGPLDPPPPKRPRPR